MVTLGSRTSQEIGVFLDLRRGLGDTNFMQRTSKRYGVPLFFLLVFRAHAESVTQFVTSEEKVREEMITISRELGVTCTECHNVQNFKDDSKKTFKVSKEHIKITQMLKDNGFDGKSGRPESTCFMCHRGKLKPDYKEPASAKTH